MDYSFELSLLLKDLKTKSEKNVISINCDFFFIRVVDKVNKVFYLLKFVLLFIYLHAIMTQL